MDTHYLFIKAYQGAYKNFKILEKNVTITGSVVIETINDKNIYSFAISDCFDDKITIAELKSIFQRYNLEGEGFILVDVNKVVSCFVNDDYRNVMSYQIQFKSVK